MRFLFSLPIIASDHIRDISGWQLSVAPAYKHSKPGKTRLLMKNEGVGKKKADTRVYGAETKTDHSTKRNAQETGGFFNHGRHSPGVNGRNRKF